MTCNAPRERLDHRIPELENAEEELNARITALTQPAIDTGEIEFTTLFDMEEIQRLQDQFAAATGVASIITYPDGRPITRPSSFCRLCRIIRETETGRANCQQSDAIIGGFSGDGPTIQPCVSGGLWDAGAPISVGGAHIASWIMGQVRDETQSEEKIREYARRIGADETELSEALREVPAMSRDRLEQVARMLFILANQLSTIAYQNHLQARHINELKNAKAILTRYRTHLETLVKERTEDLSRKNRQLQQQVVERKNLQVKLFHVMDITRLAPWEYDVVEDRFTFNDQFYKLFRTTAEEAGGLTMSSTQYAERFVHPEDIPLVKEKIQGRSDSNASLQRHPIEHRVRYADGETGHIAVRCLPVKDTSGRMVKIYGVNQDISEPKQAEAEREQLEDQLRQAQKMESVGRLAGGVAHDYNNMLGVIIGHAELALEQTAPDSPARHHLETILNASHRSATITRQLLAFARKQTIQPRIVDLNETVPPVLEMLHRLIGEQIALKWIPGADLWPVRMDPSQIDQILANLCVNAKDAIGEMGTITIETDMATLDAACCARHVGVAPGAYVVLAVSDDGCGMDRETQEKIFEPFFTTKDVHQGTGLGLATVYGIVKQNGGFINVYSEPGRGTTFRIFLPRQEGAVAADAPCSTAEISPGRGETVLLVEDEEIIIEMVERILEKLGYRVLAAQNPLKALELGKMYAGEIDLLVTDVIMPGMNGQDLATEFKALHPGIRTLFMSGYPANVIVHQGILDPGVNFLQKPFSIQDLAATVRSALGDGEG